MLKVIYFTGLCWLFYLKQAVIDSQIGIFITFCVRIDNLSQDILSVQNRHNIHFCSHSCFFQSNSFNKAVVNIALFYKEVLPNNSGFKFL